MDLKRDKYRDLHTRLKEFQSRELREVPANLPPRLSATGRCGGKLGASGMPAGVVENLAPRHSAIACTTKVPYFSVWTLSVRELEMFTCNVYVICDFALTSKFLLM